MSWAPTLPAAPSRPPVVGWFAYLTTQLVGIASGEAFGALRVAPSQYVGLTGIPSAQALGALALVYRQTVALAGIPSAEAFGGSTFQPGAVNISLQGIPSGQAMGTPTVTRGAVTVAPSGIASGEAFGTATVTTGPVEVALAGIASSETFGAPAVSYVVALTGIPSQASVGALSLAYAIFTTGIPTGEAFGTPTVIGPPQPIQLSGIASAEAFGGSAVQPGAVTIGLQGVTTGQTFGTPTVTTGPVNISLSGIPTGEAVGALNVQQTVVLTGIASAESVGAAFVTQTFPQDIALTGIGSAEAVGTATVTRGAVDITSVGGIATAEAVGTPTVMPAQFVTSVGGIATAEAFGTTTVVPPTPPYANYSDNFDRANNSSLGANWTNRSASGELKINSNTATVPAASTYYQSSYVNVMSSDDHLAMMQLGATLPTEFYLYVRSNNSQQLILDVAGTSWVIGTVSGTYAAGTVTPRASATSAFAIGDTITLQASGNVYTAKRNGITIVTWTDTGGATYGSNVNSSHREVGFGLNGPANSCIDNFRAWDIAGPPAFVPSQMTKNGTQSWATSATFVDITSWAAVNDGTYTSFIVSPYLIVQEDKTGATLAGSVPFTGSNAARTHVVRIVRSDGTVIATGSTVTAASGTATVSTTANVVAGEQYKVQMQSNGTTSGTITATTPSLTIS